MGKTEKTEVSTRIVVNLVVLTAKNTNGTVLHSAKSLESLALIVPRTLIACSGHAAMHTGRPWE